ncbi:MAG: GNAT family N-acetyltransferase [Butyrivibrio sp.]|nr:GNAT family N-acetyltransferase [Butyrivibrio sp.]
MNLTIKALTRDLEEEYFDFFDNRAFSDGSPYYPCYCNAFNMSKEQISIELLGKAESYGGGIDGWKKALRESAVQMVRSGEIQGYLAFENGLSVGWCNANDRMNYYRVGDFDLGNVPADEEPIECQKKGQIKSIVCFEIAPEYRGRGIATKLLERVCLDAEKEGYDFVEAYPTEQEQFNVLAFTGTIHFYEKVGFTPFVHEKNMVVMRKMLRG